MDLEHDGTQKQRKQNKHKKNNKTKTRKNTKINYPEPNPSKKHDFKSFMNMHL